MGIKSWLRNCVVLLKVIKERMDMKPDVSVIIPNYNCIDYLAKCIDSIVMQKNILVEIIIIDDGSTDGSVDWIEHEQKTVPQIVLIKQSRQGVVNARNLAIEKAQSEYIAFLDADDYWCEDKLFSQFNYMKKNIDCVLSFTDYMHITEDGKEIIKCFEYWPEANFSKSKSLINDYKTFDDALSKLMYANVVGTSTVMVRRSAIIEAGCFDNKLTSASDLDCWLKLANIGNVAYSQQCAMHYLMRSNSITANRLNRLTAMVEIVNRNIKNLSFLENAKVKARINECYGEFYREVGKRGKALMCSQKAFYLFPHKRNFKHLLYDLKSLVGNK
ncbi:MULTISPECIES: glycosyltransferase family 2 protein [Pseudoalteromonas]|nr:glycosyltransferase family 2 protein [Pseudoalteromonas porphyrae]